MMADDVNDHFDNGLHLTSMKFVLPRDPGVRVLHQHYLADELGVDSIVDVDGAILEEIDNILIVNDIEYDNNDDDALLERIGSILD
jgi:hypothetical protein